MQNSKYAIRIRFPNKSEKRNEIQKTQQILVKLPQTFETHRKQRNRSKSKNTGKKE